MKQLDKANFDVDASVIFQLGESLITDGYQALAELIKNSYDADALEVTVEINPVDKDGNLVDPLGLITVTDNGFGMTEDTIRSAWLLVSNSPKRALKATKGKTPKGRVPLGDKGLGRLGVQRLGRTIEIETRPVAVDGNTLLDDQFYLRFSWDDFRLAKRLSEVAVVFERRKPTRHRGTTIRISNLYEPEIWRSEDARTEVANSLSQLVSPYENIHEFQLTVMLEGRQLELASLGPEVERSSIVHYDLAYSGRCLGIDGRVKLAFFRPPQGDDLVLFRRFVEADRGEAFFKFVSRQRGAVTKYHIKQPGIPGSWYMEFSATVPLHDVAAAPWVQPPNRPEDAEEDAPVRLTKADPGPFRGEIDGFTLRDDDLEPNAALREYLKVFSGVRVFRDGFAIRGERDWLNLSRESTYGKSYYSLRPWNTLGYIAISAENNQGLVEKTDREGFQRTPQFESFAALLGEFVKFMGEVQSFLRRNWTKFRAESLKNNADVSIDNSPNAISKRLTEHFTKATPLRSRFETSRNGLSSDVTAAWSAVEKTLTSEGLKRIPDQRTRSALTNVKTLVVAAHDRIGSAKTLLEDIDKYLDQSSRLESANALLRDRLADLEDRLEEIYDIASLGLTAETLSHEISNLSDKLATRTLAVSNHVSEAYPRDRRLVNYVNFVETAVNALRKQLAHLSPALRYAREKQENIELLAFVTDLAVFHKDRLEREDIRMFVKETHEGDFRISMNRGKLSQVFDNLILNSEYWLREQIRSHAATNGSIQIELDCPFVRFRDTGPGVLLRLEEVLFEPFETAKPKSKGRGLGLYIARQLLASEGCTIELADERNAAGRRYIFELNFADVVINGR
jgi:signal transduction histidine kinase